MEHLLTKRWVVNSVGLDRDLGIVPLLRGSSAANRNRTSRSIHGRADWERGCCCCCCCWRSYWQKIPRLHQRRTIRLEADRLGRQLMADPIDLDRPAGTPPVASTPIRYLASLPSAYPVFFFFSSSRDPVMEHKFLKRIFCFNSKVGSVLFDVNRKMAWDILDRLILCVYK